MVVYSAPGKIHLAGEHAVVYGHPAIICAINRRCIVSLKKNNYFKIYFANFGIRKEYTYEQFFNQLKPVYDLFIESEHNKDFISYLHIINADSLKFVELCIYYLYKKYQLDAVGVDVIVSSHIPPGMGMGSSAALSLCLANAIAEEFKLNLSREQIRKIGTELERFAHINPSGGDTAVSFFGGFVKFTKGKPVEMLSPVKFKNFLVLSVEKRKKSTAELVLKVEQMDIRKRSILTNCLANKTKLILKNLNQSNVKKLIESLNCMHRILAELGVSTERMDYVNREIAKIGGGSKLSGAGGGGIMIAVHSNTALLKSKIDELNIHYEEIHLGIAGLEPLLI